MSAPRAGLVVVAAGTGSRLGAGVHKALVDLGGRPLLAVTLARLLQRAAFDPVVVVVHAADHAAVRDALAGLPRAVRVATGGERRQDSVLAGLEALADGDGPPPELVAIHDAARPFVPLASLDALLARAAELGAALLAVPVADTLKEALGPDAGQVGRTLPRDRLRAAQTPQAFRRAPLERLLRDALARGETVTDECALFEAAGLPVGCVEGSPLNFKITTAGDLALARAVLALQGDAP